MTCDLLHGHDMSITSHGPRGVQTHANTGYPRKAVNSPYEGTPASSPALLEACCKHKQTLWSSWATTVLVRSYAREVGIDTYCDVDYNIPHGRKVPCWNHIGAYINNDRDGAMLSYKDVLQCQAQAQADASPLDVFDVICEPPSTRRRDITAIAVVGAPRCFGQ